MSTVEKKVWDYLVSHGMTTAGAAGMMGNMKAESGIIANRVEILCLKRLKENGKAYTDETYTAAVDSGVITRAGFLNPLPGKQYGYGLCQWTSPSRKAGLYDLCKKKGASIGDLEAQLEFLISELRSSYKTVWNTLAKTKNIQTASNAVLTKFEIPADTSSAIKKTRYNYSKEIFDHMSSEAESGKSEAQGAAPAASSKPTEEQVIQKVIDVAAAEEGYLEKKSNASLDDKTSNAGSNNYTKYWRDVYPSFQGQAWCAAFISWLFMKVFGLDMAKKLLKHWPFTYCPTLAGMTENKEPKVGSIVLFYRNGVYAHTGLVIAVSAFQITTIEGNTSGASGIIANGGGVCRKTYTRSALSAQTKYFMPDYSLVTGTTATPQQASQTMAADSTAVPFLVKVDITNLNIRTGPGTAYASIGQCTGIGVFTIVEVRAGQGSTAGWGRLKSGLGWIALDYATKIVN